MKKKWIVFLVMGLAAAVIIGGCGRAKESASESDITTEASGDSGGKTDIKFYGKVIEYTSGPKMTDALQEQLADKYNIEAIQVDWSNLEKVIRTGLASGEPCDLYCFNSYDMANFSDAVVDLTPYLEEDPEWKESFGNALDAVTVDGKILAIPWEVNFPVILANKALFDEAGIKIPEAWTYTEFKEACQRLQDMGVSPFGSAVDLQRGEWLFRSAMLTQVLDNNTYDAYVNHELSFNSEECKAALEEVKSLYDGGYMYPGEGAVTVKTDEVKAAFAQGNLAMMSDIGAGAKVTSDEMEKSGIETVIVPWPSAGETPAVFGGGNCLFIPQASKNIDAAIEILKTYTSAEIQGIHAADGYIPINKNVEITDEFTKGLIKQAETCVTDVVWPAEMNDYRQNGLIPDLILNGGVDTVMEKLEQLRTSSLAEE